MSTHPAVPITEPASECERSRAEIEARRRDHTPGGSRSISYAKSAGAWDDPGTQMKFLMLTLDAFA